MGSVLYSSLSHYGSDRYGATGLSEVREVRRYDELGSGEHGSTDRSDVLCDRNE